MAAAAEPILASSLWKPKPANAQSAEKLRLKTQSKAIDMALQGGLDYGSITCISAEPDTGARNITQALLLSHLLGSKEASATVIDTGQAVDVRRLYQAILSASSGDDKAAAKATLDRVKIMKSFDLEGLTEALSELRDAVEGRVPTQEEPPRGTVADSQDDGDEMLDSPTPPSLPPKPADTATTAKAGTGGLLIIDSLAHLAAPLLKTNHASGQALLTSFMRSLAHLTRAHNLCTIIVNDTLSSKLQSNFKDESPSAFASCTARPALGRSWTFLLDVHLLVHSIPRTEEGARAGVGSRGGGQRREEEVEMVSVVEVLQDRCGGRVGRWGAFSVGDKTESM